MPRIHFQRPGNGGVYARGLLKTFGGDVMLMGAGGSAISMGAYLMREDHAGNMPSRIVVTNRSEPRLKEIERIFRSLNPAA